MGLILDAVGWWNQIFPCILSFQLQCGSSVEKDGYMQELNHNPKGESESGT